MSQQINLYNPRFRKQKKIFTANALAAGLAIVLLASLAVGMVARQRADAAKAQADRVAQELAAAEARKTAAGSMAPRQKSAALELDLAQAESDNRALQQVSAILDRGEIGNTRGYSAYFTALARTRVNGLWLTGVQITGAGTEIGLQGRALQAGMLPGYLNGLAREPVLKGKSFGHLEMGQPKLADAAPGVTGAAPATVPFVEFSLLATPAAARESGK